MAGIDDLAAVSGAFLGYLKTSRSIGEAQRQERLKSLQSMMDALEQSARTKATVQKTVQAAEAFPGLQVQRAATTEGIRATTAGVRETTLGKKLERERGAAISKQISDLLGQPIEVLEAAAKAGTLGELVRQSKFRKEKEIMEAEEMAGLAGTELAGATAIQERAILPEVFEAKQAVARAEVPEAELRRRGAEALIRAGYPEEEADIAMQLLATEPELRQAEIAALGAKARGVKDNDLRNSFRTDEDYFAFLNKSERIEKARPLMSNVLRATEDINAIQAATGDKLERLIAAARGVPAGELIPPDATKVQAVERLQAFIRGQFALAKDLGIDLEALTAPPPPPGIGDLRREEGRTRREPGGVLTPTQRRNLGDLIFPRE